MKSKIVQLLQNPVNLIGLLVLVVMGISFQSISLGSKTFIPDGIQYTYYNNYIIFKQSFFHLIQNKDLYILYPQEYWDLYKYSPTFALMMAPIAYLPDGLGLFVWNFINAFVLFYALWQLPGQDSKKFLLILAFMIVELFTSLQNSQSNGLMAGLMILAFNHLEKKQIIWASLCIVLTVVIKIFGLVAFAIFIFYPNKLKSAIYTIAWTSLLLLVPLLIIAPTQLVFLYKSWLNMLQNDHSISYGYSVAGWLYSWFGIETKGLSLLLGAILLLVPLIFIKNYKDQKFRLLYLASLLIWVVIFNHKAESPTFIIAIAGVAIWGFNTNKGWLNIALLCFAALFTILSPTDIFPRSLRQSFVEPYVMKAVPCILIWFKITWELLTFRKELTK